MPPPRRARPPLSARVRRRRAAVALLALLAAAAGLGAGARAGGDDDEPARPSATRPAPAPASRERPAREPVDRLSLEQQVGQAVVLRFAGLRPPAYVRRALREGRVAGAILFRDNVSDPAQLRRLTRALRAAGTDPLVSVDQEGGDIRIVPWAPPPRGQASQVAAGTVREDAAAAARALRAAGVTVSLAPVADVPAGPASALAGRGFAPDAEAAARATAEAIRGWRSGGVAPTAKHFPGLGAATANTDNAPVTIEASDAELAAGLAPFRAAIDAGAPLVMLSHATYPALDRGRIASQSRAIATRLLRERLGFRGVAITDSLEAAAVSDRWTVEEAALRSLRAGADLLLTTGRGSYIRVYRALLEAARESAGVRARVREAAGRVLALRRALR